MLCTAQVWAKGWVFSLELLEMEVFKNSVPGRECNQCALSEKYWAIASEIADDKPVCLSWHV